MSEKISKLLAAQFKESETVDVLIVFKHKPSIYEVEKLKEAFGKNEVLDIMDPFASATICKETALKIAELDFVESLTWNQPLVLNY